jgi:hypothetical protein
MINITKCLSPIRDDTFQPLEIKSAILKNPNKVNKSPMMFNTYNKNFFIYKIISNSNIKNPSHDRFCHRTGVLPHVGFSPASRRYC